MLLKTSSWRGKFAAAVILCQSAYAFAGQLKIEFEDVVPNKGIIRIAVFPEAAASSFPSVKDGAGIIRLVVDSSKPPFSTTVSLPNGNYAITAFEDIDNDGVLALNGPYGSPSEPWGLSSNRKPSNRAPAFSDAVFSVGDGENAQKIRLGH
ncbi:DUF2141 domain-containing protein [Paraburkholderia fungorum]|uniref:DUF2141 domain-containing protein n=1 Tax=Paraburkholderia fungorum TaxID=134537 RepID=UPI00402BDD30